METRGDNSKPLFGLAADIGDISLLPRSSVTYRVEYSLREFVVAFLVKEAESK